MTAAKPQMQIRYIGPDGRLTIEGMQLFLQMVDQVNANAASIATNAATIANHETRITALEP